jgi:hypothetical protein
MTIGLVVYDGLESLHCGADSTSAISTNARRLVLNSRRTCAGQGVRPAERSRWLFEQTRARKVGERQRRELVFERGCLAGRVHG